MALVERSMKRPVTVTMITVAALLFGAVSLSRLPLNLLPDISYPSLTIQTEYADAAPAEIEKLITEPLEEAVSVVPGLKLLRSVSRPGVSEITLEFGWKTNMDFAALDVREKIDLVNLPDDADKPVLLRYDPSLDPILRVGLSGDKDLVTLRYLGERVLKKDLESLDGVASVRIRGGLEEEIHVAVDEKKLAALGIPIRTVSDFLMNQNLNAAGGRLRDRDAEFLVRTTNEFESMDDIRQTVLFEEANRRVKLEDVSTISRGYKEREVVSRVRGRDAVELSIYKEGNANTVQVARAVKSRIEWLNERFDEGVRADVLFDQSTFIEKSIQEVRSNAVIGGILAVFVLFLFLKDRRSTGVISLVIPISVLTTFFAMQQFDVSLNIMSLGGLALGIGMLVDNAIVVLESINRHRGEGKSTWDATLSGATEVSRAVIASTLTTVAVFLPIIFVEGIAGQIFRDQALTVTASLVVSLIAALTLIPVLASVGARARGPLHIDADESGDGDLPETPSATAARAAAAGATGAGDPTAASVASGAPEPAAPKAKRRVPKALRIVFKPFVLLFLGLRFLLVWIGRTLSVLLPGMIFRIVGVILRVLSRALDIVLRPVHAAFDRMWNLVAAAYPPLLEGALARPARTIVIALLIAGGGIALVPSLGVELVPPFSQGEFAFDLELPPGTPLQKTADRVGEIEKTLANDGDIGIYFTSVGESPELGSARNQRRENIGQINIATADKGNAKQSERVIEALRTKLQQSGDIDYTFRRPSYFTFQTPIELHVYGYDLAELQSYASQLALAMAELRGFRDVRSTLEEGSPEVQIAFRRDRMAALDLDLATVSATLRNKIRGDVATRLKERDRQIDILVRSAHADELEVAEVSELVVSQVDGIPIPLSTVADITIGRGPSQITHIGQQRAAVIRANLTDRDLGSATRDVEALVEAYPPPPTLAVELGGQNREVATSFRSLLLAVSLAVFMVYLVMASQFESFLHPFVILLSVPLGMVGVILALAITGTDVSIVVLIGAVMLTGIVVNNAIVLIDFINQRRRAGIEKMNAVLEGARTRLRPILMTTLTTVLGLLPMAIGLGEGAEIRAPMAIAVIGGLVLSTLLTLVVVPVVYVTLDRKP